MTNLHKPQELSTVRQRVIDKIIRHLGENGPTNFNDVYKAVSEELSDLFERYDITENDVRDYMKWASPERGAPGRGRSNYDKMTSGDRKPTGTFSASATGCFSYRDGDVIGLTRTGKQAFNNMPSEAKTIDPAKYNKPEDPTNE